MRGPERRELARTAAFTTDGVTSRDALLALGLTHADVRTEVAAGRWRCHGLQTVALHCGPIEADALRWQAIWETGAGVAALDGVTALQVAGLTQLRRRGGPCVCRPHGDGQGRTGRPVPQGDPATPDELVGAPASPAHRPAVAALRAASWAVSDRQAALVLLMTVQQRLATPRQLLEVSARMPGRRRRRFVDARACRRSRRGPVAGRARLRANVPGSRTSRAPRTGRSGRGPRGRIYLDVRWAKSRLVVEIDGAQHREGLNVTGGQPQPQRRDTPERPGAAHRPHRPAALRGRVPAAGRTRSGDLATDRGDRQPDTVGQSPRPAARRGAGQGCCRAFSPPTPTPRLTPSTSTERSWPVRTVRGSVSRTCLPIRPSSGSSIG